VSAFSLGCKSYKFLIPSNFKVMSVILILITSITLHKIVVSGNKSALTDIVSKVESFQIVNKNIPSNILNTSDFPTFVNTLNGMKDLSGSMSYNFSS